MLQGKLTAVNTPVNAEESSQINNLPLILQITENSEPEREE